MTLHEQERTLYKSMSVRQDKVEIAGSTGAHSQGALDSIATINAAQAADGPHNESSDFNTANSEHPLKRTVAVSIRASLNDLCLRKAKSTWSPTNEALKQILQQKRFTDLNGTSEMSGDLKARRAILLSKSCCALTVALPACSRSFFTLSRWPPSSRPSRSQWVPRSPVWTTRAFRSQANPLLRSSHHIRRRPRRSRSKRTTSRWHTSLPVRHCHGCRLVSSGCSLFPEAATREPQASFRGTPRTTSRRRVCMRCLPASLCSWQPTIRLSRPCLRMLTSFRCEQHVDPPTRRLLTPRLCSVALFAIQMGEISMMPEGLVKISSQL